MAATFSLLQLSGRSPVQKKTLQNASQRLPIYASHRVGRVDFYDMPACRRLVLSAVLQETGFSLPLVRRLFRDLAPQEPAATGTITLPASGAVKVEIDLTAIFKNFDH